MLSSNTFGVSRPLRLLPLKVFSRWRTNDAVRRDERELRKFLDQVLEYCEPKVILFFQWGWQAPNEIVKMYTNTATAFDSNALCCENTLLICLFLIWRGMQGNRYSVSMNALIKGKVMPAFLARKIENSWELALKSSCSTAAHRFFSASKITPHHRCNKHSNTETPKLAIT